MKKVVSLHSQSRDGLVAQLDRVPDYGSGGCGFDSRLVHLTDRETRSVFFCLKKRQKRHYLRQNISYLCTQ